MIKKSSYSKAEILKASEGNLFGEDSAKLPKPPMLMIDRILKISDSGGKYNKGSILAELNINPKNWFFDCHFKGDPVMPGCLGLDGFWQLLGFFLSWSGGKGRGRALGVKELKFKGQVRPYHDLITYKLDIKKIIKKPVPMAWADASLSIKNKMIYFAKDLQVGLFESINWDYGADPALDTF
ncbi:MAG: bifunctional 3-hydroxydecanoyl-ACP dehydratase/trans-2-decenoyl-ACP isomerase [Draconibacterium sp.]|nr:bifunctional 3-hydroxydecanoyl-ACP dehydratase/trans-2-decenoyl-ACP isomerase [Draconibacterium sp.]